MDICWSVVSVVEAEREQLLLARALDSLLELVDREMLMYGGTNIYK